MANVRDDALQQLGLTLDDVKNGLDAEKQHELDQLTLRLRKEYGQTVEIPDSKEVVAE